MITSKQRAYLRSLANTITPIFQIGKGGINDNMLSQLSDALDAREIIKITVLENSLLDTKATCSELATLLKAEPVQAIGSKIVIYRMQKEKDKRKITLPK